MKNILSKISIILLAFVLFISGNSCKKEVSNEYPFVIKVIREDGIPLGNVNVRVTADVPNAIPDFRGKTDVYGEVRFEYDNKAVLKVQASRGNPISWIGCGFIRLEEGQVVNKTIVIQPYDPNVGGC
jgi:hypothetical protein